MVELLHTPDGLLVVPAEDKKDGGERGPAVDQVKKLIDPCLRLWRTVLSENDERSLLKVEAVGH